MIDANKLIFFNLQNLNKVVSGNRTMAISCYEFFLRAFQIRHEKIQLEIQIKPEATTDKLSMYITAGDLLLKFYTTHKSNERSMNLTDTLFKF